MIVRRALLCPLILLVAVIGQLAIVNRAPLPGGGGVPDLVLLAVMAFAVTTGPTIGMLAGFAGGLAIDIAPPGGHLAGEYALVYCLAGYACGRIRDLAQGANAERSAMTSLTVMAVSVTAGEAGKAGLGMMLSDPNVTGPAIRQVLPAAVIYDLLLCPFVLWLVSAAVGHAVPEGAPQPRFQGEYGAAPVFRSAAAGAAPKLRLAGSTPAMVPPLIRAEPRLRLAGSRSPSLSGTNRASSTGQPALAGGRAVRLNFAAGGASALRPPRPSGPQPRSPGKGFVRAARPAGIAAYQASAPGKGWIRPGKPASPASFAGRAPGKGWIRPGKPVSAASPAGRAPRKGWIRPGKPASPASFAGRAPGKGWIRPGRPVVPPDWRRKAPGKGWARTARPAAAPPRKSPGRGWLRPAKPPAAPHLRSPGRGWLRTSKPPRQNWYTRSPSTRWLRRGRRRRLLLGGRR